MVCHTWSLPEARGAVHDPCVLLPMSCCNGPGKDPWAWHCRVTAMRRAATPIPTAFLAYSFILSCYRIREISESLLDWQLHLQPSSAS